MKATIPRRWLIYRETDAIPARLQTDYLRHSLFAPRLHDENLTKRVHALGDLIRAARSAALPGLSNFCGWRIAEVRFARARKPACRRPSSASRITTLLNRAPEWNLPACGHYDQGGKFHSSPARGVLTGNTRPASRPSKAHVWAAATSALGNRVPRGVAGHSPENQGAL
jgi:aryl-alcohol dehydrogenase-like predicted oxidoreductase